MCVERGSAVTRALADVTPPKRCTCGWVARWKSVLSYDLNLARRLAYGEEVPSALAQLAARWFAQDLLEILDEKEEKR